MIAINPAAQRSCPEKPDVHRSKAGKMRAKETGEVAAVKTHNLTNDLIKIDHELTKAIRITDDAEKPGPVMAAARHLRDAQREVGRARGELAKLHAGRL